MSAGLKPTFAPVPMRAFRDKGLGAVDLRLLGAIAVHDRFNTNGQACWASNERLAEFAGCHVKSVPRAIARLIKAGYLKDLGAKPGRQRSRSRFLMVVYNEQDAVAFERKPAERKPEPAPASDAEVQSTDPVSDPADLPIEAKSDAPASDNPATPPDAQSPPPKQPDRYDESNLQDTQREKRIDNAEACKPFSMEMLAGLQSMASGDHFPRDIRSKLLGQVRDKQQEALTDLAKQLVASHNITMDEAFKKLKGLQPGRRK